MEKGTKLGQRKRSEIVDNPECVGVGKLVGCLQWWLAGEYHVVCVSVLHGGGGGKSKVMILNLLCRLTRTTYAIQFIPPT